MAKAAARRRSTSSRLRRRRNDVREWARELSSDRVNHRFELRDVDRFREVVNEPGIRATGDIFVHPESAEADAFDVVALAELAHQVQPAAVRQADVADDHVKSLPVRGGQRRGDVAGVANGMLATKQSRHAASGVIVVLNEEDLKALRGLRGLLR